MTKKHVPFALSAVFSLLFLPQASLAVEQLDEINVQSNQDNVPITERKVGENIKSSATLSHQQVQDTRDIVKYETGVSVVETGRMGSSGYAIRGVDENRVNITIDGLQQAQTLSSQGFKELFEGYGNFNNTRNGVEIENIKQVNITKGADSTKVGDGALGGSVIFETKDARDFLMNTDFYFSMKEGYRSDNDEWMYSPTLAARWK